MDYFDVVNGQEQDLADQVLFDELLGRVKRRHYDAGMCSPPCSTFSRIRGKGKGPRALRSASGPGRYGLPGLTPEEKEAVRLGTLLGIRARDLCSAFQDAELPWLNESPPQEEGQTSLFGLDEWIELSEAAHAVRNFVCQCMYGATLTKSTELRGNFAVREPLSSCTHDAVWWRLPPSGSWHWGAHPPLFGKILAVRAEDWSENMRLIAASAADPYLTRSTAAYPYGLNLFIARELLYQVVARRRQQLEAKPPVSRGSTAASDAEEFVRAGYWSNTLVRKSSHIIEPRTRIGWTLPLREQARTEPTAVDYLGGLRKTASAVAKLPQARAVGSKVRELVVESFRVNEGLLQRCLAAIGDDSEDCGPQEEDLRVFRQRLGELLGTQDIEPLNAEENSSTLCGGLLEAWTKMAGDPDLEAAGWPRLGAPAGILLHPQQVGVFPPAVEDADIIDPEEAEGTFEDPEQRQSYQSVEDDDHAVEEVARLASLGFIKAAYSVQQCVDMLDGDTPIVSKFGQVVRVKNGKTKRRLVLDSKESQITRCGRKNQRIVLPVVTDLVFDALQGLADHSDLEWLVLDIKDAFWTLGLKRQERRYFVGKLRGVYYLFQRLAQGSRGAPLAWCRFFALVSRLTQAMFSEKELRSEVYVDDPALSVFGQQSQRNCLMGAVILVWRSLNLNLAFAKGQRGTRIDWIGSTLWVHPGVIMAAIKQETKEELISLIGGMLSKNVTCCKALRSLAGKLSNSARLLTVWRPFLGEIWAALAWADNSGSSSSRAPSGTIWTKQVAHSLRWFLCFLQGFDAGICRPFFVDAFITPAEEITFIVDASPWGFGAVLLEKGAITEYFWDIITKEDQNIIGFEAGSPDGQQAWECLCMLLSLHVWWHRWCNRRCLLRVKGDNVTMLTLLQSFKGSSRAVNLIAREAALLIAAASFKPVVAEHLPGITNVLADGLSRRWQPGKNWVLPAALQSAKAVSPPQRPRSWYRTLSSPSGGSLVARGTVGEPRDWQ